MVLLGNKGQSKSIKHWTRRTSSGQSSELDEECNKAVEDEPLEIENVPEEKSYQSIPSGTKECNKYSSRNELWAGD